MKNYSWSFDRNSEIWSNDTFDTTEECIADANHQNEFYGSKRDKVYIGETHPFIPSVCADSVLEQLAADAYDEVGAAAEGWDVYDPKKQNELNELNEKLSEVVCEWMKKYGHYPSFYAIKDIKEYPLLEG